MSTVTQTQTATKFSTVADSINIPRGTTRSTLTFYAPPSDGSKPYLYVEQAPENTPQRNYGAVDHEVDIHDIRGHETQFDMNKHGFGVAKGIESKEKDFADDDHIRKTYYPEVEQLLLSHTSGKPERIFIFDHTIRRSEPGAKRAPVNRAHIDQTTRSAHERVRLHMGDEAEKLLQGRVWLINVWRPLNGPVVASPLAYADSRSVPDADIVPVEHRYPHRTGETAGVQYAPAGTWYYWSGMTNDERIFLQCYDSQDGARTPHSAFVDSRTQPDWPGRESIEVRALVFG